MAYAIGSTKKVGTMHTASPLPKTFLPCRTDLTEFFGRDSNLYHNHTSTSYNMATSFGCGEPRDTGWQVVQPARARSRQQPRQPQRPAPSQPRLSPRKWRTISAVAAPKQTQKRVIPMLVNDSDNDAETSWRARHPATDSVRIPDDLTLSSERHHDRIARQHGTFLFSDEPRSLTRSRTFGIWGNKDLSLIHI